MNKMMMRMMTAAVLCFATLFSLPASAWQVDAKHSSITYLSSKRAGDAPAVLEQNRFKVFRVSEVADDALVFEIDLNSIDTGIELRDERLKEHLFQTDKHPKAVVRVPMAPVLLKTLQPGDLMDWDGQIELNIGDQSAVLDAQLSVVGLKEGGALVATPQPILVRAESFGWLPALAKLQKLAGLASIDETVPVSVRLKLQPSESNK